MKRETFFKTMVPQTVPTQFEDVRKAYRCGWQFGMAVALLKMADCECAISYPTDRFATDHEREAFSFAVHRGAADGGLKESGVTNIH
jgi:hypothetical protein